MNLADFVQCFINVEVVPYIAFSNTLYAWMVIMPFEYVHYSLVTVGFINAP